MQIIQLFSNHFVWIFLAILVYIIYTLKSEKKQQNKTNELMPKLFSQYRKESVFLCKWADIFEGADSAMQMQGLITSNISNKNKIINRDGSIHSIIGINILTDEWKFDKNYPDPVLSASAGKKVLLIVSGENWNLPPDMDSSSKFLWESNKYPEWNNLQQMLKDEMIVIFKLQS